MDRAGKRLGKVCPDGDRERGRSSFRSKGGKNSPLVLSEKRDGMTFHGGESQKERGIKSPSKMILKSGTLSEPLKKKKIIPLHGKG